MEQFAEPLFWRLDEEDCMHFKRVASTGEAGSFLEAAVKWLEKQARLYKPFEVFGPDDIDWRAGKAKKAGPSARCRPCGLASSPSSTR